VRLRALFLFPTRQHSPHSTITRAGSRASSPTSKRKPLPISNKGLAALKGLSIDDKVLAADFHQGVFKQSFEEFSGRMISKDRLVKGVKLMQQHAETIKRIEKQYGVPGSVIVAIWGLETDYGVNQSKICR
jgi:membrane-bound lytic murein transglycosylase B